MKPGIDETDAVCEHCGRRLTMADPPYCGACEEGREVCLSFLMAAADWDDHSSDVDPGRTK